MATIAKTEVEAAAQFKITHRWHSLFGIIGSWREVASEQVSKPSIFITTTKEYEKVFINGKEYAPRHGEEK